MFYPGEYKDENSPKDLHNLLLDWIGGDERLAILDLSNVRLKLWISLVG